MARGFGSTFGVGATDNIATALQAMVTQRSYFFWYIANGDGAGSNGRLSQIGNGGTPPFEYIAVNPNPTMQFNRYFTGTVGSWECTRPANSATAWHTFGISYDAGATTNTPVMYVDGVSQSVSTVNAPVGTGSTGATATGLVIGNADSVNRNWDGVIGIMAVWNTLLTAGEFSALAQGVLPRNIRWASIVEWFQIDGITSPEPEFSGTGTTGTVTGTAFSTGPPIAMFTPRWPRNIDVVAAAAGGLGALLSSERSRLVGSGLVLS